MKRFKASLVIALLAGSVAVFIMPNALYGADTDKSVGNVKSCRDKIAIEREAILADNRRLEEAKKTGDKAKIEQVKQETNQDIKDRKAAIRVLYRSMDRTSWGLRNREKRK